MRKIVRVEDVPEKERADIPAKKGGGFLSMHDLEDGRLNLSDKDYCIRFGSDMDWKELRARIVERRKALPAFIWVRCKNPKCGWTAKMKADLPLKNCWHCNWPGYREHPGWLEAVTSEKEVKRLEAEAESRFEQGVKRLRELAAKHKEAYNAGLVEK